MVEVTLPHEPITFPKAPLLLIWKSHKGHLPIGRTQFKHHLNLSILSSSCSNSNIKMSHTITITTWSPQQWVLVAGLLGSSNQCQGPLVEQLLRCFLGCLGIQRPDCTIPILTTCRGALTVPTWEDRRCRLRDLWIEFQHSSSVAWSCVCSCSKGLSLLHCFAFVVIQL